MVDRLPLSPRLKEYIKRSGCGVAVQQAVTTAVSDTAAAATLRRAEGFHC